MLNFTVYGLPIFEDNYIWILSNGQQAIAVDPGDADPLLHFLSETHLELAAILITHHHADHTGGLATLNKAFTVPVYGPQQERIEGVTHPVGEAHRINLPFLDHPTTVLTIPGHTKGHIAYWLPDTLFCGDTLFSAGCGRIFEGTPAQMYQSLQKLASLPDATRVYCTHEYTLQNLYFARTIEPNNLSIQEQIQAVQLLRERNQPSLPSTIANEKRINPFLRCHIPEVHARVEEHIGKKLTQAIDVFAHLREWKNHF